MAPAPACAPLAMLLKKLEFENPTVDSVAITAPAAVEATKAPVEANGGTGSSAVKSSLANGVQKNQTNVKKKN